MNITVYLGANEGNDPSLRKAVQELGTWIGASGNALVYGGSKTGLMGEIAKSVLDAGGNVTGVEPQFFMDEGFQYDGLTELIVTKDMSERKNKMIELGDAFIAFHWHIGGDCGNHVQGITEAIGCSLYSLQFERLLQGSESTLKSHDRNGLVFKGTAGRNLFCGEP